MTPTKVRTQYRKIEEFTQYIERLRIDKADFTLIETNFTKTLEFDGMVIMFNEEGAQDAKLLKLINMVRNDASKFDISKVKPQEREMRWFDLSEKPKDTVIAKVDVRSAYWETALMLGIISGKTDNYLRDEWKDNNELKKARLKALGSLATKKRFIQYVNGRKVSETSVTQPTKAIYLYICEEIDKLMHEATYTIKDAFYYYWDCVFCCESAQGEVIEFVRNHNYGTKIELTTIDTLSCGGNEYLVTATDSKMYLIPRDKTFLLHI